ncbi:MAG: thioredoxin [Myxococcales bacterium]|nr:thioredoxin [Myxococcales bacterium]
MSALAVTDATFEAEVLQAELPVLIDLHADWCGPCKQVGPLVDALAQELAGRLKVVKVDVDRNPGVAQAFRVQSIPMLVVMQAGQVVQHHLGALSREQLRALVEPVLGSSSGGGETAEVVPKDLAALLKAGRALAVDIREATTFARYHIPGAVNIPQAEVEARAAELQPTDGRVRVLYARTTDEAKELAATLRDKGVPVGFLAGGFLHWEADDLEVERG